MHKYLMAGSAALALAMGGSAAEAQDFKVSIRGDVPMEAYFGSAFKGISQRNVDIRNRFRLIVNPEAVALDGALTFGAAVRLLAASKDGTTGYDWNYLYAKGAFGTVFLGDQDLYDDNVGILGMEGFLYSYNGATTFAFANAGNDFKSIAQDAMLNGDFSKKIRYDSPFISGMQFSVSYTPRNDYTSANGWGINRSNTGGYLDVVDTNFKFDSTNSTIADRFGAAKVQVGLDYIHGDSGPGFKGLSAYKVATRLGYDAFTFGANYYYGGESGLAESLPNKPKDRAYTLSAEYQTGPYTAGINYSQRTMYHAGAAAKLTQDYLLTGVKYNLSKGLDLYANYAYVYEKNATKNASVHANILELATKVSF